MCCEINCECIVTFFFYCITALILLDHRKSILGDPIINTNKLLKMLGCLDDLTAELQALGHLVGMFSLKRARLGC